MKEIREGELVDFGPTPPAVNALLQSGVALYRQDRAAADAKFREALALDPSALATWFCLYKTHAYGGALDEALALAEAGLAEAARQAGLPADWTRWRADELPPGSAARFAVYTLKATAFLHLRRGESDEARRRLEKLASLDAVANVGAGVVADLARAVAP